MRPWRRRRRLRRAPPFEIPGTGVTDFAQMIYGLYYAVPPALRRESTITWVMDPWWLHWCEEYAGTLSQPEPVPGAPPVLLGVPVLVIETGGWPHLEPASRSHPHLTLR